MTDALQCSVVIPTIGRFQILMDSLNDIARQDALPADVLIVTQDRFDAAEIHEISRTLPGRVRIFELFAPNASIARNIGLKEASGEIVLFLDDDVRIESSQFIDAHLNNYADETLSGVYGQVLEVRQQETSIPSRSKIETDTGWRHLPANYALRCHTRNGASNNLSVRRDWAIKVGGMDGWYERGARREETDFNLRYTKRYGPLVFDPQAGLTHLSAGGGSRSWGRVRRIVPMHHIVGHWYFLLRTMLDRTMGARGLLLELRHIAIALLKNPQVGRNPLLFIRNAGRGAWGLVIALTRMVRGARRIDRLDPSTYYEVTEARGSE